MKAPTLILPSWLIAAPPAPPKADWGIRVVDDLITHTAPNQALLSQFPNDAIWKATGMVLAPGFVDSHTHLYGVLAHGIPLNNAPAGFWQFLTDFWWPKVEDQLDTRMICDATAYQCASMLRGGVTSFYDCTEAPHALPGCLLAQAEVVRSAGLRGILSFEATERVSAENGRLGLDENTDLIADCQVRDGLVSGMMCVHTSFTCSAPFIRLACERAAELNVLTHMHMSEGTYEPHFTRAQFGLEPVFYYDSLGVLGSRMLASQCVQVSPAEIRRMAEAGVRVSHMPLSNCEVGGGIAPLPEMVAAGLTIGLGSDGYITDFFEVMRGAFLIHKASHCDPQVMPAGEVWRLACDGGAQAIGLRCVGRLEQGWQADFILIKPHLPTPLTERNLYDQLLLYCHATDVQATVVAGQIQMFDRQAQNVDIDELLSKTNQAAARLW